MESANQRARFTEQEFRHILERAASIDDELSSTFTLQHVHNAARDVGISDQAIATALAELNTQPRPALTRPSVKLVGKYLLAGVVTAIVGSAATSFFRLPFPWTMSLLFMISGGAAFASRTRSRWLTLARFETRNGALFVGTALCLTALIEIGGGFVPGGFTVPQMIRSLVALWLSTGVVGGTLALLQAPTSTGDNNATPSLMFRVKTMVRRHAHNLVDWLFAEFASMLTVVSRRVAS